MIELNTFLFENAKTQKADPNDMKNPNFFPVWSDPEKLDNILK